jgi:hypothetical protein
MNGDDLPLGADRLIAALACPEHGWLSHAFVHEAAHAIAALDREIRFEVVSVLPPDEWEEYAAGGSALGGVRLSYERASEWVRPDPVRALEFALAGAAAEKGVYGHCIGPSYSGDLAVWAGGMGVEGEFSLSSLAHLLPEPPADIWHRTQRDVKQAWPRIRAVVQGLSGGAASGSVEMLDYVTGGWSLSEAEVRELAASAP